MSQARPTYVGYGECTCGRIEVLLYRIPGSPKVAPAACGECLVKAGWKVPAARTADDLEVVDGALQWKDGT